MLGGTPYIRAKSGTEQYLVRCPSYCACLSPRLLHLCPLASRLLHLCLPVSHLCPLSRSSPHLLLVPRVEGGEADEAAVAHQQGRARGAKVQHAVVAVGDEDACGCRDQLQQGTCRSRGEMSARLRCIHVSLSMRLRTSLNVMPCWWLRPAPNTASPLALPRCPSHSVGPCPPTPPPTVTLSQRSRRTMRPAAPTTTRQSEQPEMNAA